MPRFRMRNLLLLAGLSLAVAADPPAPSVEDLAKQGAARSKEYQNLQLQVPDYSDTGEVKRMADLGRSRGQAEFEQLRQQYQIGVQPGAPATGGAAAAPAGSPVPTAVPAGLVVVALSSSMPEQMVRDYLAQLDGKRGAVVVLRGFIGGAEHIVPTGKWLEQIMRVDPTCEKCGHRRVTVQVDPLVFASLNIRQVPAVAYLPGVSELKHCDAEPFKTASVAYGAAPVDVALQATAKGGAAVPKEVIAVYTPKGWEQQRTVPAAGSGK